jgi:hypothetical protein
MKSLDKQITHRTPGTTRNKVAKSINRQYRKVAKQWQTTAQQLLHECGGGNVRAFVYGDTCEDIIIRQNKQNYPKPVSRWTKAMAKANKS